MGQSVVAVQAPQMLGRLDGTTNYASVLLPVTSGVTINEGDFVYFASGYVTNATVSGARLLGYAESTVTGNATGTNTVLVCIDPAMRYLIKGSQAFASVTNGTSSAVGQYFDISGTTGAQVITETSGGATTGQFLCISVPGMTNFPNTGLQGLTANLYAVFVLVSAAINPYVAG
jgi:hypothetical protein